VDVIQAVLARRPTNPADFDRRVKAVAEFRKLEAATALAAANKRVANILAKVEGELPSSINPALLQAGAEQSLAQALLSQQGASSASVAAGDYNANLTELAGLRAVIDQFFDEVMVNVDDQAVRNNRLALLNQLRQAFLQVADISLLQ
jgi:glycyl-tRNA synthetase beta chain